MSMECSSDVEGSGMDVLDHDSALGAAPTIGLPCMEMLINAKENMDASVPCVDVCRVQDSAAQRNWTSGTCSTYF